MTVIAFFLTIVGFGLWFNAYLNVNQINNTRHLSFATTVLGGREQAAMIYGMVGCTLFVLGTLSLFGLVTLQ